MTKVRSPNFPVLDLQSAIEAVGKIYAREKRGKFPKTSAASHLGYSSLNGRSLGLLGALRAYSLLDGKADDLIVSPDAIALIEAPAISEDRAKALERAFRSPPMFARIQEQYPEAPSPGTLKWWLIQQGFVGDGAEKAAGIYLSSLDLVTRTLKQYDFADNIAYEAEQAGEALENDQRMREVIFSSAKADPPARKTDKAAEGIAMGVHERILQSGMLSKTASFKVIVSGAVGIAEIDRLIRKIEMDKEILADLDDGRPDDEDRDPNA